MPTYEFRCPNGHDFDQFYRSMSSAPTETKCPVCGAVAERRMSAGSGLVFKGTGFYITDYGKDGKKDQRQGSSDTKPAESKPASESKKSPPAKSGE
ncbi:MAG TPA: zinc ribbon domain-containing protein [Gemmatimonadaceae bacterium]|jgi:putative FmdB family regulatory protein|nr:zinc ribbon domain-containing protein [Gemmatimonadaceae bacterium]